MTTMVEAILDEFRDEAPATRRVLERVPGQAIVEVPSEIEMSRRALDACR